MRLRFLSGVLLTAAAATVFALPVNAGTITEGPAGSTWTFTAAAGETNDVVVGEQSFSSFALQDSNPITIASGSRCAPTALPNEVVCSTFMNLTPIQSITLALGDGNDTLSYHAQFAALANGGEGNDLLGSAQAPDTLNGGPGIDGLFGNAGGDLLIGGDGNDNLDGGGDNDTLQGGNDVDTLNGAAGNDSLAGGDGIDTLYGTIGNDTLDGGGGPDVYFGGDGNDRLVTSFDADDFNGEAGIDTVDYTGWNSLDTSCSPDPCPIGVDVSFDDVANDGSYDLDQDTFGFAGDNVHTDVESVVGTSVADTLNGGAAVLDQRFTGAGGNDAITGGPGTDTVVGDGDANWTLTNTTLTGAGTDAFTSIEAGSLTGGASANTFDVTAFTGSTTLAGLGGDDTFRVGTGADTLVGGAGADRLVALADGSHQSLALGVTTLIGLGDVDTFSELELATLTGDAGNNALNGGASPLALTLQGGAGVDTLTGGSGPDTLTGAAGVDTLDGGGGTSDRVVESADANLTLTNGSLAGSGTDSLLNIELATLFGGPGANTLNAAGFSGAAILNGEAGGDTLIGGSAGATLNGGDGPDTLTGGAAADTLNGGDGADTLAGGIGTDTLNGDAGPDALNGGADVDTLNGGDDDDALDGGPDVVNDALHGGAGANTVVGTGDMNFTLSDTTLVGNGIDTFDGVQRATLTGGAGDNTLNASAFTLGPVVLNGGSGADTLFGGPGGDTLIGGPGVDTFDAGAGADTVQARDAVNESSIVCGTEADTAVVDVGDAPNADCEIEQLPDTTAPNTKLKKAPKATTKSRTATFRFTSTEAGSKFQCKLDRKAWASCKAPKTYKRLKKGKHTFQVRAIDKAGNRDKTPAKKTWRIT